ncbi:Inositol P domain containing protein [Asbolus verrucosus]|uniref:Inositol P domain containing protein n=1 Tax=Asbolus verrucosus TaxID=1661398 RepID=A0A482WDD8_ASBVE|nr:Inositol P domain containing protein [Asbolus verrucosus]
MSEQEIQTYFDYVLPLVKKSGKVILEAKDIEIETKEEIYDLVTIYDRKVEEVLIEEIKKKFPSHKFIGEEESSAKSRVSELTDDPTWIIDPIDGTANFVRPGVLIVREAGGAVKDSSGKEFDIMNPNFIATASKELLDQFLVVEKQADEERLAAMFVKKANIGCK